jgi:glycerol-3-phosphate acyltransferase PlsX
VENKVNIGLDIAGGDFAPGCNLEGAKMALAEFGDRLHLTLFGNEEVIRDGLKIQNIPESSVTVVDAPEIIEMGESPLKAFLSKPNSSIAVGFKYLKEGKIDGFASAGSTGAMFGGAVVSLGTVVENIRPCLMTYVPKPSGRDGIILDIGASADSKPENLYQFAVLGSTFAQIISRIDNPRVGLLNIGEEPEKGNELTKAAYKLMEGTTDFNFVGNVEGHDFFRDKADVYVCNGFTGNVIVKFSESWYQLCRKFGINNEFLERFNFENQGGSPVLGVNGAVVIGHGISNGKAIKNMIGLTMNVVENKLSQRIKEALSRNDYSKNE